MADIRVLSVDHVHVRVEADEGIKRELSEVFTFEVPGAKWQARKRPGWDGKIRLFNRKSSTIYRGLLHEIESFAEGMEYSIEVSPSLRCGDSVSSEGVEQFMADIGVSDKFDRRSYQTDAVASLIEDGRGLLLSPTGSGKSMVIYLLSRWYSEKVLVIVPTRNLVEQMRGDFVEYGMPESWIKVIQNTTDEEGAERVVISTWQSLADRDESYFSSFGVVIGDEAHLFKAKSLVGILEKTKRTPKKFAFTGTLDGSHTHKMVLEGLFGRVRSFTTTRELIDDEVLADLEIKCLLLRYSKEFKKSAHKKEYHQEVSMIVGHDKRNRFIRNLALSQEGNVLVLYQFVEKHGQILYDLIEEKAEGRRVFYVHGGVESEEREQVRKIVEAEDGAIVVASAGTFSTGVNIPNLHCIIGASPSKSRVRVLQSIGRGLRRGSRKDSVVVFDIADDLVYKNRLNYTMKHFHERVKYYTEERFNFKIHSVELEK